MLGSLVKTQGRPSECEQCLRVDVSGGSGEWRGRVLCRLCSRQRMGADDTSDIKDPMQEWRVGML